MPGSTLPLFPLHAVLFPGGLLPLRIFEQRYVAMAKACLAEHTGFGVCLIRAGEEVARRDTREAPAFAPFGTIAEIVEWDMPQLGILHVVARGTSRFRVESHAVQPDGLVVGTVVAVPDEPAPALSETFAPLAKLLELVAARVDPRQFPAERRPDDASWVGYRLAEVLPLPLPVKQSMLEINDAELRLTVLARFLKSQQLL